MPRAQPGQRFGGRTKGTPNKITKTVKDMVEKALTKVGGVNYLAKQAEENPTAFLTLVGKVLPLQVTGDPDSPVQHKLVVEFVNAADSDSGGVPTAGEA